MKLNKDKWWYRFAATFNENKLYYRTPRDVCSLVRSLLFGWGAGAAVCLVLTAIAVLLLVVTGSFWVAVFGGFENPLDGLMFLLLGGIINTMLLYTVSVVALQHYDVERKVDLYFAAREHNKRVSSPPKEPSLLSEWLKGIKEKTCHPIEIDYE